jgi:hypothetical protein
MADQLVVDEVVHCNTLRQVRTGKRPRVKFHSAEISEQKMTKPKNPAAPVDIEIAYAGTTIMVSPRSPTGQQWLDSDRRVRFAFRDLDTLLDEARRARLKIAPLDQCDAVEEV